MTIIASVLLPASDLFPAATIVWSGGDRTLRAASRIPGRGRASTRRRDRGGSRDSGREWRSFDRRRRGRGDHPSLPRIPATRTGRADARGRQLDPAEVRPPTRRPGSTAGEDTDSTVGRPGRSRRCPRPGPPIQDRADRRRTARHARSGSRRVDVATAHPGADSGPRVACSELRAVSLTAGCPHGSGG